MLTSLALILLVGLLLGSIFNKLKLPGLLGMLITGIMLSPHAFNLLDQKILTVSSDLRQLALVIILTRAGLSLDIKDLIKVGRPAVLMSFLPATLEILAVIIIAPKLLEVTMIEAAIMGSVIAAVSPAVIVPRMIKLIEEGYGKRKSIPGLILASASVDDVYVIVLFSSFISLATGDIVTYGKFIQIPVAIILGVIIGIITGLFLSMLFKKLHMRDSAKVVMVLGVSFLLIELENQLNGVLPISGLLAIMSMGITLYKAYHILAKRLALKYNKLWVAAEIILFVLVGATLDLKYAIAAGTMSLLVIVVALLFRMLGVYLCLINTTFTWKERLFCMLSYIPKATVQAAIGAIPLSMGLACGQKVVTVAVLSIVLTAPLGALGIDHTYKKLLDKE
ncbi:cation:proton antiporter [Mobilitalea sibirica]|uniref:Cation:proton antiporter n=1 Tax=Mobilitalea sibirica TaxID=1462919 RepID=A0A8J7HCG1_9FIRM|nr:cation:proton antiporter [Mobilitalea sibirica]MBH1942320.1 cation:proton antiporter [Mobilitalea sibirica]